MSVRRVSSAAMAPRKQARSGIRVAVVVAVLVCGGVAVVLWTRSDTEGAVGQSPPGLDDAAAVAVAVDLVVAAGGAGAQSNAALREVQGRRYATDVAPGLTALTLRAAAQQRSALLEGAPPGARLLERTVPVGYQVTRRDPREVSVAVWTVQVAGPDRGRRSLGAWWLTTRVDLVAEAGAWRVRNAVAVQGPAPRPVRVQQAGVGSLDELRGMLRSSRRASDGS